ncbi:MAG TPA: hypothetical protein VN317_07270, partial [Candidatus Methanoperedens sp.]|nr:hypothetical protein [Candidatus Methanoperedens sp.]
FLMGRHSTQGWLSYFPLLLLLKTPLPFLALAVAAAASRRLRTREALAFLALPAAVYFAAACLSRLQIGHRYILPIYPFLIVGASALFARSSDAASRPVPRKVKALAAVLLAWYLVGTVRVHPWHLSYVNEVVGSQDRAYRYFTDSNVDWGQGLKELAGYLRQERIDGVYLCYFGSADPGYYGIRYLPVRFFDGLTPEYAAAVRRGDPSVAALPRTVLAISATNLQATYYPDKQAFSFLRDVTPSAIVAHSILVYDLDRHPAQRRAFRDMLGLPVE